VVEWREKEGGVERERVGLRESEITFACCCFFFSLSLLQRIRNSLQKKESGCLLAWARERAGLGGLERQVTRSRETCRPFFIFRFSVFFLKIKLFLLPLVAKQ
jgi:hypothetical protein